MNIVSPRVLGLDPMPRGIAWIVLEGSERLIDWGITRQKTVKQAARKVSALRDQFLPDLLVIEDPEGSRRGPRAIDIIETISLDAEAEGIPAMVVTREAVSAGFAHVGTTKQEIAEALARVFPELEHKLPTKRKPWEAEDERMGIFDALSFAMTALSILSTDDL